MSTPWNDSPAPTLRLPDLQGKTALVTGASLGIGRASVKLLLENGVRVFGLSRKPSDIAHPDLIHLACDLSDMDSIDAAFAQVLSGTESLDYVVNVAGMDPKYAIDEVTVAQWDHLLDLNLRAYYFIIKKALPLLRLGTGRSIVNVSSINYRLGVPGRAAYSASKAGILGLTTGLSRELGAENIRVNTVSPGWTFTERQIEEYFVGEEAERHLAYLASRQSLMLKLTATDIANHILFYLSEYSRASTAHNCVVDGGWILE
jgi:NAD(P)-dependent dehydrogenase (short-subunit alcohol dehydrogenase family)